MMHDNTTLRCQDRRNLWMQQCIIIHNNLYSPFHPDPKLAGKMSLAGEQNDTNYMGVKINPTAQFQPATHVLRFKILNALDVVRNLPLSCHSSDWHYFSQICKRIRRVS
jgi:hypothetical protein